MLWLGMCGVSALVSSVLAKLMMHCAVAVSMALQWCRAAGTVRHVKAPQEALKARLVCTKCCN